MQAGSERNLGRWRPAVKLSIHICANQRFPPEDLARTRLPHGGIQRGERTLLFARSRLHLVALAAFGLATFVPLPARASALPRPPGRASDASPLEGCKLMHPLPCLYASIEKRDEPAARVEKRVGRVETLGPRFFSGPKVERPRSPVATCWSFLLDPGPGERRFVDRRCTGSGAAGDFERLRFSRGPFS
jgi:hypothetical protein